MKSGSFKVAYLKRDLILSNGNDTYYFTVDEKPNFETIANDSNVFEVDGIVKWKNTQLKESSSKAIAFKIVDEGASCTCESVYEPKKPCKSGGEGSTSCSQGDCSVACNETHYACCNE